MKKLFFALALMFAFSSPALALMDYTELRGLWEVKGTIYRVGPDDGLPTAPIEENLFEIGQIPPILFAIGDRDYTVGYSEWSGEELQTVLRALEAFITGGMISNLNEAIEQFRRVPYIYLPYISKHNFRDMGVPIDGWYGMNWAYPTISYPHKGDYLTAIIWTICDDFSKNGPWEWEPENITLLFADVIQDTFTVLRLFSVTDLTVGYDALCAFSGVSQSSLEARVLTSYHLLESQKTYTHFYKLTMERR